jgi:arsenate reductase (glutaredoxin)
VRIAEKWADSLGGVPLAFIHKTRDPLVPNQVKSNRVVGEVQGKTCVLIDDMIDTGGTIAAAVKLLHEDGAKDVVIAATHGVLSEPAAERLADSGACEVIVTNTLPITADKVFPQLTVLSIAPLLASTIRAVFENGSVTGLFNGDARMTDGTIYHNPRCSTSRKTLELLRDNGIEPTIVEYLKNPPSRAELAEMISAAGIGVRDAVRTGEAVYAELNLADASDDELLDAMAAHPILIQRPFVVTDNGTRLARPIDAVREIL